MITLTLLHPIQSTPVQSWTFEHEPVIRIGRSTDNHVILYSAVVSRHHVELRRTDANWEIVNLGANGTYLDGKQITQIPVVDGVVIRLARSGPNIQIHLGSSSAHTLAGEKTLAQRARTKTDIASTRLPATSKPASDESGASYPSTKPPKTDIDNAAPESSPRSSNHHSTLAEGNGLSPSSTDRSQDSLGCSHSRAQPDMAFCPDCGQPLKVLQVLEQYQIIKPICQDRFTTTQLVWCDGKRLLLKTLKNEWANRSEVSNLFETQAKALLQLHHPGMPRFIEAFRVNGQPCLVMEPIYGQDLHQWVADRGVMPLAQAIPVLLQVCDVLSYLHCQAPPFLHQDIRPENLICRSSDAAGDAIVLSGFVPLNSLQNDTQPTAFGYFAPEQQQGHPELRSDLYALGPTLAYLLTGKQPGQFYAHREQGYRFYPEYIPGLLPDVVTVIRRLTNPNPEERYASAEEVADALNHVVTVLIEKL